MEILWQDVRHAVRILARHPGLTLAAVLTLALGLGANTAILSVVSGVLLQPLPYAQPERLVTLAEVDRDTSEPTNVSYASFLDLQARVKSLDALAVYGGFSATHVGRGEPERLHGMRVTGEFFRLLRVRQALGRDFLPAEHHWETRAVVILDHRLWQRRFGSDPNIVGTSISLGGTPHTVVGVLPADFRPVLFGGAEPVQIWAPLGYEPSQPWACRTCRHLQAIGRIRRGFSHQQVISEMDAIAHSLRGEYPSDYAPESGVVILPARERLVGRVRDALMGMTIAAGFVLLIGCANVANLLLAHAAGRQREMALRAALGAGYGRLVRQVLTESLLLAAIGGGAGLLLALWIMDLVPAMAVNTLPRLDEVRLSRGALAGTALLALIAGLLIGLGPALALGPSRLLARIRAGAPTATVSHERLRGALVVSEIATALVLVIGAGLLIRSFMALLAVHPGFEPRNVLTLNTYASGPRYPDAERVAQFYAAAFERIGALPRVEAVGAVTPLPISGGYDRAGLHIEGRPVGRASEAPSVDRYQVAGDYLRALRIPLVRGRDLAEEKLTGARVALISESLARMHFPDADPLGKRIRLGGPDDPLLTIVGIVGDVRQYGLHAAPTPQVYTSGAMEPATHLTVLVRAANAAALTEAIKQEIWAVDRERPLFRIASMDEVLSESLGHRRLVLVLAAAFGGLALLLASIGVFGVMAYTVAQRTQEIGIRVALGAGHTSILRLIVGRGMVLISVGVALGVVASLAMMRFLGTLLFGVTPADPATYLGVTVLFTLVALAACSIPARRAVRLDPIAALRTE